MKSEAELNKVVDFRGEFWSERNRRRMKSLDYLAALIATGACAKYD